MDDGNHGVWYIHSNGNISSYDYYIRYSYGPISPDTDGFSVCYITSGGDVSIYDGSVDNSYGMKRSPGTNMSSRTFHSDPKGDVWYDSAGAGGVASYGVSFAVRMAYHRRIWCQSIR